MRRTRRSGSLRDEVRRAVRASPHATAHQIAARLGCTAATVRKHARALPFGLAARTPVLPLSNEQLRTRLAEPRTMRRWMLCRLAGEPDHSQREAAARHPACPPVVLSRLAGDRDYPVRSAVASHPQVPRRVLAHLVLWAPRHQLVMRAAAREARCPPRLLAALAQHSDRMVRDIVAARADCPQWLLQRLRMDRNFEVHRVAHRSRDRCRT